MGVAAVLPQHRELQQAALVHLRRAQSVAQHTPAAVAALKLYLVQLLHSRAAGVEPADPAAQGTMVLVAVLTVRQMAVLVVQVPVVLLA
jgi:hypothetical protein